MLSNPKLGRYTPEGMIYPTETITGKPYARGEYDPPPAIIHNIGEHWFAVGDVFPPRDFNVEVALDVLRAEIAAVRVTVATDNSTGEAVVVPTGDVPASGKKKEDKP